MTGPYRIRPARPEDVPAVVAMVHELAEFEKSAEQCRVTETQLHDALFADSPAVFCHIGTDATGTPLGMMLWFIWASQLSKRSPKRSRSIWVNC